jgi:HEAT repeat protein
MLTESDADVRAAAAWALSQMGPAGAKAVPGLTKSLADPNPLVRSLSAVALRSMGPKAVDALPALILALRQVLKLSRVTASAEEAILKINRQPVPTWF